ncbi:42781_t:CDS:1, partial [Gigaspora margarita]
FSCPYLGFQTTIEGLKPGSLISNLTTLLENKKFTKRETN